MFLHLEYNNLVKVWIHIFLRVFHTKLIYINIINWRRKFHLRRNSLFVRIIITSFQTIHNRFRYVTITFYMKLVLTNYNLYKFIILILVYVYIDVRINLVMVYLYLPRRLKILFLSTLVIFSEYFYYEISFAQNCFF